MKELPGLYFIADVETAWRLDVDLVDVVADFVRGGGRMVSLRPGSADDRWLMKVGREISALLFSAGGRFFVHRRLDLAMLLGADGVHLPSTGLRRRQGDQLMGKTASFGRSCHDRQESYRADKENCDFITLGPVFESVSKPGYGPHIKLDEFGELASALSTSVYALGGVTPQNAGECLKAGAAGIAVVGGIMGAEVPMEATARYLECW